MRVDIWSDIVCPFCYLGKRNFELALAQFEHRDEVEIHWHSFELDQNAHEDTALPLVERIAKKYSLGLEESAASQEEIAERAREVGLEFNWRDAKCGNSFDAHRIIHHATARGLAAEAQEAFKRAYFTQGRSIEDHESIREIASGIGLDAREVDVILAGDHYADDVRADERVARELGITGVPFFLLEAQWVINGAQPPTAVLEGLNRVWAETHKPQTMPPVRAKAPQQAEAVSGTSCGLDE